MIRLNTFSMHGYQQVQVDMYYVKKELSNVFLDPTLLDLLLDDILTNAKERCIEPKPFDENVCTLTIFFFFVITKLYLL